MQKHSSGWIQYMFGSKSIEWCLTKDFKKCNKDIFLWPSECSSWLWLCCERWGNNAERCHKWRKETLERNPAKERKKENCFQQSFDCLLNDRKRAVYCHLGMKLAWCMLDKSRVGGELAGGQIKQPRLKFLGRPREVFAWAESDSDTQRGRGIIQLGQQGFKEVCQIGKNLGQKNPRCRTSFTFCLLNLLNHLSQLCADYWLLLRNWCFKAKYEE